MPTNDETDAPMAASPARPRRARRSVAGAALALLSLVGGLLDAPAVGAAETPVVAPAGVEAGTVLPSDPFGSAGLGLEGASPGYVLASASSYDEYAGQYLDLRRAADASVVRRIYYADQSQQPRLDGSQLLRFVPPTGSSPGQWTSEDAATGQQLWTIGLDSHDGTLWVGTDAVLAVHQQGTTGTYAVDLLKPDGSRTPVVQDLASSAIRATSTFATSVALTVGRSVRRVDTADGSVTSLVAPEDIAYGPFVTATRTLWGWRDWGAGVDHLSWWNLDGSSGGTVAVADARNDLGYVPFGDRLAAFRGSCSCDDLRPVDLTSGVLESGVTGVVAQVVATGDGSLTFSQRDGSSWRLATLADDGQAPSLAPPLPDPGRGARTVGLSGARVAADLDEYGPGLTKVAALDGSGAWSGELTPGETMTGALVAVAGDTVLTSTEAAGPLETYHLWWPGGHRDLAGTYGVRLGRGGELVQVFGNATAVVQESRTGRQVTPVGDQTRMALDGTRLVETSADGSRLTVTDTATGAVGVVPTGLRCTWDVGAWQVVGRYALLDCDGESRVIDLTGAQAPYAAGPAGQLRLGAGFVLRQVLAQDPAGTAYATMDATELAGAHRTRRYGLVRSESRFTSLAPDDAGAPVAVYVDGARQVRRVDLSWIQTAAPIAPAPPSSPRAVTAAAGDRAATVSWAPPALHPEPITGYVVTVSPGGRTVTAAPDATSLRVAGLSNNTAYGFSVAAKSASGTGAASALTQPATPRDPSPPAAHISSALLGWSSTSSQTFTFTASDPTDASSTLRFECRVDAGTFAPCTSPTTYRGLAQGGHTFSMRAVDPSGNHSAVDSRTWIVDTIRPIVTMTAPTSVAASGTRFAASFRNGDRFKAGAQARYVAAPYTSGWRSWVYPTSWRSVPYDYVTVSGAAGWTYCVSVRGWDLAGNYSAWAPSRCAATPVDDRSLTRSTGWTRVTSRAFSGGSALRSTHRGARLTRSGIQTRRIYLVASRCISCGTVGVYWNGALVRRVSLQSKASGSTRRAVIGVTTFAGVRSGRLTLRVLSSGRPVQIDGVVLPRV